MNLSVLYQNVIIGNLFTTSDRGIVFSYTNDAKKPISISMPNLETEYSEKQCLPFFDGLLPEGAVRERLANLAHVSRTSSMKLLSRYGADVAGALTIIDSEELPSSDEGTYVPISEEEIARRIHTKSQTPLIYSGRKTKLSLAGAENKVPVLLQDGEFYLPTGSLPTNHIIKASDEFVINEYICTKLASLCSLPVSEMEIKTFNGIKSLLIKRYDRNTDSGKLTRLHQEDFCQALGIMSDNKYEESGGPGMKECIFLINTYSYRPLEDIKIFLKMAVFNFIIGNCDAHSKNFSFLYEAGLSKRVLSPFYDIVCSSIDHRFDQNLAMRVGRDRELARVSRQSFGKAAPRKLVDAVIDELLISYPKAVESLKEQTEDDMQPLLKEITKDSQKRLAALDYA